MNDSQISQVNELKKLNVGFYRGLAFAVDPLTYTYKDKEGGSSTQVAVAVEYNKRLNGVLVHIDFDTDSAASPVNISKIHTFYIDLNDNWIESSYDGSEFIM